MKTSKSKSVKIPQPPAVTAVNAEKEAEILLNQLLSGDPKLVEKLQTRDAELAKQEADIQQQRQRIVSAFVLCWLAIVVRFE